LYLYFKYGRAAKPGKPSQDHSEHGHAMDHSHHKMHEHNSDPTEHQHEHHAEHHPVAAEGSAPDDLEKHQDHQNQHGMDSSHTASKEPTDGGNHMMHHHMDDPNRPFWATVLIGVSHCGAGCVLGDLVGEWLVYGTGATINGKDVWPCLLVDYAFALFFGIFFQYFSIGPMTGQYGPLTLVRAAKADFLSLTFFEIGLFGWMVAYQVGIWDYKLEMNTWCYWWQMQVGMFLGFWTAFPINWWLLKKGIKEPCA
jgi:hypothetical protein